MDYKKHYNLLIDRVRSRILESYTEKHHIIPVCMGGSDDNDNIVSLTAEEHFFAHVLLLRIYRHTKYRHALAKAVRMMMCHHQPRRNNFRKYRKLYGWLKTEHSLAMSESQRGECNSQYGTTWICNIELKKNEKIKKTDPIPVGWVRGRWLWEKEKVCKECGVIYYSNHQYCSSKCRYAVVRKESLKEARTLFEQFLESPYDNTLQFATSIMLPQNALTVKFRRYIPEYAEFATQGRPFNKNIFKLVYNYKTPCPHTNLLN